MELFITKTFS